MAHVQKGGLDLVLVTKLDRAFRSAKDTYDNLAYLEQHNVGFIPATQPIDTSTSTGKLLLGVLAAVVNGGVIMCHKGGRAAAVAAV